jgi:hypothetical protein
MRVAPEETAAAPIETEAAEQKHIPGGERFHGCVSHTRPNFGNLPELCSRRRDHLIDIPPAPASRIFAPAAFAWRIVEKRSAVIPSGKMITA